MSLCHGVSSPEPNSVLNVGLLLASLDANRLFVSDENLLLSIKLELIVNRKSLQHLDLILVQNASLDLLEVPCDEEASCRSDDRSLFTVRAEVVKLSRFEVNRANFELRQVLSLYLKLEWVRLLLAHAVIEASLAV